MLCSVLYLLWSVYCPVLCYAPPCNDLFLCVLPDCTCHCFILIQPSCFLLRFFGLCRVVLCSISLYSSVMCSVLCAAHCCAVVCVVLWYASLCFFVLRFVPFLYAMLRCDLLCSAMGFALIRCAVPCYELCFGMRRDMFQCAVQYYAYVLLCTLFCYICLEVLDGEFSLCFIMVRAGSKSVKVHYLWHMEVANNS
jgi:hypothetical protein